MKLYLEIKLKNGQGIRFGRTVTKSEIKKVYKLRYQVYVKEKEYIPVETVPGKRRRDELEIDSYDQEGYCTYFIATMNNQVVASARIIKKNILPTEQDYFEFETPSVIAKMPRTSRAEIGRIISRPQQITKTDVPRSITMLGLFYAMSEYGKKEGIEGGYGSIKKSALDKFISKGLPLHIIENSRATFDPTRTKDPLLNFFDDSDPVILIYFVTKEINDYLKYILTHTSSFVSKEGVTVFFTGQKPTFLEKLKIWFKFRHNES